MSVAGPRAIPISTAVRGGDELIVLGLGARRETLRRLRDDPAVCFCLLAEAVAFTAHGRARVLREGLRATEKVVAVAIDVQSVQDHLADGRTEMLGSAPWVRPDAGDVRADTAVVSELTELVAAG